MSDTKVKVLYIGGYSRSGSTLLLRFLGQVQGFVGVGEVWDIWRRSFVENQLCGCGQPFGECQFWRAVVADAFGGFEHVDAAAMHMLRQSVQSNQHVPQLVLPMLRPPAYQAQLRAYAAVLGRLYRAIHRVSGSQVIVDSSKVPPYAFLLQQVPELDLHIIHLVRDSRATAYSWQRKKIRPEIHWKTAYMDRYSPVRSGLEWSVMNGLLQSLARGSARYVRIRYEDLVEQPRQVVTETLACLGLKPEGLSFPDDHAVRLGVDHTLSGNPNRFEQGTIKIQPDVEWQSKMSFGRKALVGALTWPLLLQYGYLRRERTKVEAASAPTRSSRTHQSEAGGLANRLRVLLVTARFLPYVGGTEIHTFELAHRLAAAGHTVTVLTTKPGTRSTTVEHSGGIEVIRVPAWPGGQDYYFAPEIYRIIQQRRWDILHCQGYHTLVAPITMLAARRARIPYIVTFHSGGHSSWLRNAFRPVQQALLRPLLARAERLVGVSHWEADYFRQRLGLPADQFAVIPNGSYLPQVEAGSNRVGSETLIVSVGRLERYKGHHRVLAALPAVAQQCPGIRLRIVGSGPYETTLRQLAHDLGVADRVEFRSVAGSNRDGMASLLMGAALVILLSNYESQSISIMEALALGRPVLVADTTALHELAAGGLARATPLGSTPEAVARAIVEQLREPLIPARAELPSWEACARDVLALYQQTLAARLACAS